MKVAEEICYSDGCGWNRREERVGLILVWTGKINEEHQDWSSGRDIGSKCLWPAGRVRIRLGRLTLWS